MLNTKKLTKLTNDYHHFDSLFVMQVIVFCIVTTFLYAIFFLIINLILSFYLLGIIFLYTLAYILVKKNKLHTGVVLFIVTVCLGLNLFLKIFGLYSNIQFIYMAVIVMSTLCTTSKKILCVLSSTSSCFLLYSLYFIPIYTPYFKKNELFLVILKYAMPITACAIIIFCLLRFISLKKSYFNHQKAKIEVETEIKLGKKIQESYLVTIPPHYEAYPATHFNAYYKGAKQVSGDYYTAHLLDKHRLRFVILDINGKGLEAAFTMIHTHTIIEPYICSNMPPHECLAHINNDLLKMPVKKTSCDLFFGELDLETRTLTYSNASLEVAYVIKQNKQVVCLNMSGFKTGLLEDETYTSSTIRLEKGDTLLFATDGLVDMLDQNRPEGAKSHKYAYTGNRLKQFLASKTWEVGGLKERLVAEINRFEGDLPQIDDTTFLTVEFG